MRKTLTAFALMFDGVLKTTPAMLVYVWLVCYHLCYQCGIIFTRNTEAFLRLFFQYLDWIRRNTDRKFPYMEIFHDAVFEGVYVVY